MKMRVEIRPDPRDMLFLPDLKIYVYANPQRINNRPVTNNIPTELGDIQIDRTYMILYEGWEYPAHEFGHFLGLKHPGHMVYDTNWIHLPNHGDTYTYVGQDYHGRPVEGTYDLMGHGQPKDPNQPFSFSMQPFYYNRWLAALNKSEGIPGCHGWHIDHK